MSTEFFYNLIQSTSRVRVHLCRSTSLFVFSKVTIELSKTLLYFSHGKPVAVAVSCELQFSSDELPHFLGVNFRAFDSDAVSIELAKNSLSKLIPEHTLHHSLSKDSVEEFVVKHILALGIRVDVDSDLTLTSRIHICVHHETFTALEGISTSRKLNRLAVGIKNLLSRSRVNLVTINIKTSALKHSDLVSVVADNKACVRSNSIKTSKDLQSTASVTLQGCVKNHCFCRRQVLMLGGSHILKDKAALDFSPSHLRTARDISEQPTSTSTDSTKCKTSTDAVSKTFFATAEVAKRTTDCRPVSRTASDSVAVGEHRVNRIKHLQKTLSVFRKIRCGSKSLPSKRVEATLTALLKHLLTDSTDSLTYACRRTTCDIGVRDRGDNRDMTTKGRSRSSAYSRHSCGCSEFSRRDACSSL